MMPNGEDALCLPVFVVTSVVFLFMSKTTQTSWELQGWVVGAGTSFLGFLEPKAGGEGTERLSESQLGQCTSLCLFPYRRTK